jgi:DNA-binding transcriptional regulator YiaG
MMLHHYRGALLRNVWLKDGFHTHETKFGVGTSYDDIEGLFSAITLELCLSNHQLNSESVRFLRKRLEMTQDELGIELGCSGQAIAKWEKGEVASIPMAAARLVRLLALVRISPSISLERAISEYNESTPEKMVFTYSSETGWQCAEHKHDPINAKVTRTNNVLDFAEILTAAGMSVRIDTEAFSAFAHNDKDFERHATKLAAA